MSFSLFFSPLLLCFQCLGPQFNFFFYHEQETFQKRDLELANEDRDWATDHYNGHHRTISSFIAINHDESYGVINISKSKTIQKQIKKQIVIAGAACMDDWSKKSWDN
jgi:hypothetical protein